MLIKGGYMKFIYLQRKGDYFIPAYDEDKQKLSKVIDGEIIRVTYKKSHSPNQHRAVFAITRTILENAPEDNSTWGKWGQMYMRNPNDTIYNFIKSAQIELGYVDITMDIKGNIIYRPKSLQYDEMPHDEFNSFFNAYVDLIVSFTDIDKDDLIKNFRRY